MLVDLQGLILSVLLLGEKYKPLYVVYPPEEDSNLHDSLLYSDTAAELGVYMSIS